MTLFRGESEPSLPAYAKASAGSEIHLGRRSFSEGGWVPCLRSSTACCTAHGMTVVVACVAYESADLIQGHSDLGCFFGRILL